MSAARPSRNKRALFASIVLSHFTVRGPDTRRRPIESLNARYRRAVEARIRSPTERTALKTPYLVTRGIDFKGTRHARWTTRWKPTLNAFAVNHRRPHEAAETSSKMSAMSTIHRTPIDRTRLWAAPARSWMLTRGVPDEDGLSEPRATPVRVQPPGTTTSQGGSAIGTGVPRG